MGPSATGRLRTPLTFGLVGGTIEQSLISITQIGAVAIVLMLLFAAFPANVSSADLWLGDYSPC